jgi:hypothetical protein
MPPGLATAAWYADNVGRLTAAAARTLLAARAAREDLFAGFTAERDMGTEGAGSADTAVRDAIDKGLIPGPRLRISGNAIDMLGGHEDANGFNPEQHPLPNASYANSADELVAVILDQHKHGSDFVKIYETGRDIGQMKAHRYADIIAVPGNPLDDIAVVEHVVFVAGVIRTRRLSQPLCRQADNSCHKCADPGASLQPPPAGRRKLLNRGERRPILGYYGVGRAHGRSAVSARGREGRVTTLHAPAKRRPCQALLQVETTTRTRGD